MATNPKIVQKLWELNKNARDIADGRPTTVDSSTTEETLTTFTDSATSPDASPQWHCAVSCDLGTDTSDLEENTKVGVLSESDLKRKHDEVRYRAEMCFYYLIFYHIILLIFKICGARNPISEPFQHFICEYMVKIKKHHID